MPTGNPKILNEHYEIKQLSPIGRKSLRYKRLIAETVKLMIKNDSQFLKKKTYLKYA